MMSIIMITRANQPYFTAWRPKSLYFAATSLSFTARSWCVRIRRPRAGTFTGMSINGFDWWFHFSERLRRCSPSDSAGLPGGPEGDRTLVMTRCRHVWASIVIYSCMTTTSDRRHSNDTSHTSAEKIESFEWINSIRETNGNFDSCDSCKQLVPTVFY